MKHYIDCEFDGLGGQLLSMALVSETGKSMYAVMDYEEVKDAWVCSHVVSVIFNVPRERVDLISLQTSPAKLSRMLDEYFKSDREPHVVADWPDDLKYLCEALITGPGTMIDIPGMEMSVKRVDAYPTKLEGAIHHATC